MTQVTVIEVTPQEKAAIDKILQMYLEDEQEHYESQEEVKYSDHIYHSLQVLANMYMRLK